MNQKLIAKTLTLQLDQSDCGVACLLSLIQYYGGTSSLEKLRELSGTTKQGTTLLGLYQTANQLGFTAQGNEADIQALIDHGEPLILHVIMDNKMQHYVVCYGYEKKHFLIGDPANGIVNYSKDALEAIWVTKTCLTLSPNNNFVKATETKKSKKKWFLQLIKDDTQLLIISVVLGIGIAPLGMAMSVFSQKLIDDILPSKDMLKLISGIGLLTFLLLVRIGFSTVRELMLIRQSKDFNNRIIDSFYTSLLHLPKPFFDTRKIGELVARLNDTNRVQSVIKLIASNFVIDILVVIVSFGFLFFYSWQVGIIAMISIPIYFFIIYRFNNNIIKAQKEVMQGYALNESNYINSMQGITTIKNFNKQSFFQKMNQLVFGNFQNKIVNLGKINVRLSLFAGFSGVLFLMAILSFTSLKVFQKEMQLGELMAVLGIAGSLLPSITNLALISIPFNEAKIAFNRMFEFTSISKEKQGTISLIEFESLEISNLSFRFAGRSQLLKNIHLSVKRGQLNAIVGESGSGKSTIGQILQKFYDFENGNIFINKTINFRELQLNDWRDLVGVVPQEITIFNGNVLDNMLLGEEDTPEKILSFFKEYGFEEFINNLPQGFATILGEEGINLSGGQKQLIALARVLYKKPQFLILDEATAAMDKKTEEFCIQLISKIKNNMGILFISHRLETLKKYADIIYVLENGEIITQGNHHQLLKTDNFYSNFWKEII
ncbi:MAG: peptidase domain-containing ABC transporter [Flavobacteriia bacterium]|nr:peptidase domain-containing ABC transporter [Flavobacteriia bacterium]OIP47342.1 MAG: peptidase C39 [Flavobacteriaceae bacterium CG2_30_31_66]PIV95606.1 MAG: peptidase C39 [Flavobacteriaceae bacterium CG17_big_fil_post_rev_8_21_14_2_50_31_13]PIX15333.1 MAG: peptidase C39 [Flavobacteriaceae bacterium CG_4_8_14_3_um_filter_31_8]PIY15985.1 MAG: peptidase C39 [Flavobacteriaceae bacterium CG_4_10_14_3_um_filter_31_253]PIZ11550.1 MAG: peptidase C39 [Flavobacteriaceae bacterium CG_4_10_14_0_8_um_f